MAYSIPFLIEINQRIRESERWIKEARDFTPSKPSPESHSPKRTGSKKKRALAWFDHMRRNGSDEIHYTQLADYAGVNPTTAWRWLQHHEVA